MPSPITALPPEVFDYIACQLDGRDLKAFRLAKTNDDATILRHLFRHIRLSMLKHDRDVFLTVASRPYLAKNVQCLDWIHYQTYNEACARWLRQDRIDNEDAIDEKTQKLG